MMTMIRSLGLAVLMLMPALPAAAATLDVAVGEDTVRMGLSGPLSGMFRGSTGHYDVGAAYRSESGDDVFVPHVGVLLTGDTGAQQVRLSAGLGLRAVYLTADDENGGGLALGGEVNARLPGYERVVLGLQAYGAPEATSFGDVEDYYDVGVNLGYEVIKGASVYVAWREVRADLDPAGKIKADDGLFGGLRLNF